MREPPQLPPVDGERRLVRADAPAVRPGQPASLPITPAFESRSDPYVIRLPRKPAPHERPRRRGVAPVIPILGLLALLALAGTLAYLATADDDDDAREARPATTAAVLGTSTTLRQATTPRAATAVTRLGTLRTMRAPGRPLFPVPPPAQLAQFDGAYVRARNVRVESLVGDEAFWIGERGSNRILVHLTSRGESGVWVRAGSRVSFVGAVAPNPAGAALEWGLIPGEGPELLQRQGRHIEVLASKLSVQAPS